MFPDSRNPNTGVDRCFNLISLDASAHVKWTHGLFALKPLELSSDRKSLLFSSSGKFVAITTLEAGLIYLQNPHHRKARRPPADMHCLSLGMMAHLCALFVLETCSLLLPRTPKASRYQAWAS